MILAIKKNDEILWEGVVTTGKLDDVEIPIEQGIHEAQQGGADQPATAPESKPEGDSEPQPDSEGRSP
jgi:hypothetical protein